MSGRFKPYLFILLGILLAAILLNAPVAFASKLPTACNIFNKTQIEKSGPCGHQALFPNENPLETKSFFIRGRFWHQRLPIVPEYLSFLFCSIVTSSKSAAPLRC